MGDTTRFRHRFWRGFVLGPFVLALGCAGFTGRVQRLPDDGRDRPNIVLILADDLRPDVLGPYGHPTVRTPHLDRLAREGAVFENAFTVTPQCSPSRAAILTGTYGHVNGVRDNSFRGRLEAKTFAEHLQAAGYSTAFIGKWHIGDHDAPRPGFDHWVGFRGQGRYFDVDVNVNGTVEPTRGYSTDVLTRRAVEWIHEVRDRPFLLIVSFKSVHLPLEPPPRHKRLYARARVDLPPSYHDPSEELPVIIRDRFERRLAGRDAESEEQFRERIRRYWRMVPSVDENVGRIRKALVREGILDESAILFTSDNGLLLGEHGLSAKGRGYDPSLRVPLLVRYPRRVATGTRFSASVLNLDLAPTILDLAGLPVPAEMQGRSLLPLFDGSAESLRSSWLYIHPYASSPNAIGVRTDSWKYILHRKGTVEEQLIDLVHDPEERTNLAGDPLRREQLDRLRAETRRLLEASGAPAEWMVPLPP